jgi:DNA-binding YbaB/EbfC family protein
MFDFRQLQKMQQELQGKFKEMQDEMAAMVVEGSSGGGMVNVKINGNYELQEIKIGKDAVDPDDIEMLEDLVLAAVNNALEKVTKAKEDGMSKLTGGFKLPGMPF